MTRDLRWVCPKCNHEMVQAVFPPFAISCEIPLKMPSLNEYINACRKNAYEGARMKKQTQKDITWFINKLPKFSNPVEIHFEWKEGNKKRDHDNVTATGHKFILDALVAAGKLKDDNRNYVVETSDSFTYSSDKSFGVTLYITEII